jgi:hypothetical protein
MKKVKNADVVCKRIENALTFLFFLNSSSALSEE